MHHHQRVHLPPVHQMILCNEGQPIGGVLFDTLTLPSFGHLDRQNLSMTLFTKPYTCILLPPVHICTTSLLVTDSGSCSSAKAAAPITGSYTLLFSSANDSALVHTSDVGFLAHRQYYHSDGYLTVSHTVPLSTRNTEHSFHSVSLHITYPAH